MTRRNFFRPLKPPSVCSTNQLTRHYFFRPIKLLRLSFEPVNCPDTVPFVQCSFSLCVLKLIYSHHVEQDVSLKHPPPDGTLPYPCAFFTQPTTRSACRRMARSTGCSTATPPSQTGSGRTATRGSTSLIRTAC